MKKVLALVLAAVMCAAVLAGCAAPKEAASSISTIKKSGELVMLTNAQFPPYEYLGNDNKPAGVDIDIANLVAKELGVEVKVVDMDFDGLIPALNGGKGDFVAAGLTITDERKQSVDFSEPYANATQLIIVNKTDAKVKSPDDLMGKTIGVQLGTTGDIYVTDVEGATVKQYKSGLEAAMDLANGKLDAVVLDRLPAQSIVANNDTLALIDEPFTEEQYAMAIKKGDKELTEVINKVLKQLIDEGKIVEMTASHAEMYAKNVPQG